MAPTRLICDACRHAPPLRRALCEKPALPVDGTCDEKQCDWIKKQYKKLAKKCATT